MDSDIATHQLFVCRDGVSEEVLRHLCNRIYLKQTDMNSPSMSVCWYPSSNTCDNEIMYWTTSNLSIENLENLTDRIVDREHFRVESRSNLCESRVQIALDCLKKIPKGKDSKGK